MIELRGLKKSFNKLEVLKGIDLRVEDGSVVGIIGASCSGKSTLLRCLDYLEKPDAGAIVFDELSFDVKNVTKAEVQAMTSRITMVFQSFNLFKYKKALENVMEGLVIVQKKSKEEARQIAEKYLAQVGLLDRKDHYPNQLSGPGAGPQGDPLRRAHLRPGPGDDPGGAEGHTGRDQKRQDHPHRVP